MKTKLFILGMVCMICSSLITSPKESFAAERSVSVTLPNFEVRLNENKVENLYRQYPLLVYKDITYVPMTWYDCRLLGLETEWSQEDGLKIVKGKVTSSYEPYITNTKNRSSYKAVIPSFDISVNGVEVDNSKEEYPLLSYNDIIYFPMTWKFAHDEFGWDYVWNDREGLNIHSDNPHLQTVNLPSSAGENNVALFNGYYYFTETSGSTNQVYRVPETDTSDKELVYSYDGDSLYGFNNYLKFWIKKDELWFSYHVGGATMGSDVFVKVNDNGKAEIDHQGYRDVRETPKGTLIIDQSVPPKGNNLLLVPIGKEDQNSHNVGKPNFIYGWHIVDSGGGRSFGWDQSTTVIEEDVYVLGSSYPVETGNLNHIYKINLNTNQTDRVINSEVNRFGIFNSKLFYVKDEDQSLYSSNMDGSNEQKLSDNKVAREYGELEGNVYYTVANTKKQLNLYKAVPDGEDTLVLNDPLESVQFINNKIICKLAAGEDYGLKILDKSGELSLAITDQASDVFAYNDTILFVSAEDKSIKLVK